MPFLFVERQLEQHAIVSFRCRRILYMKTMYGQKLNKHGLCRTHYKKMYGF